jgi:ENTS family enterobactin (siderophore) exporter
MDSPSQAPQPLSDPKPWAVFAHRDYTVLWAGVVSMSVTMVLRTLISAQWLYETTGSPAQLGLLGAVQLLQMPVALYGGTLADRVDRKKLMAMTQGMAFGMLLLLTSLAASNALQPWHIFAATGISGMVNMLGAAARPAMLPRVIPRELLPHAVAVQVATRQVSMIFAPIIFWQVFERYGVTTAFAIATVTAFISLLSPILIHASGKPEADAERPTTASALKEGFRFVMGHRLLPGLYLLDIGVVIVSFYRQLFPIFADQLYGLGAAGTGLLNTADAVGGIIGTFLVFYTSRFRRKGLIVLIGTLVYAVFLFAFGANRIFPVGLVIVAILGATDSISMTMRQTIVQLTTPDMLLGRASSAHSFAAMGANHLGQIEVGVMSGLIGAGNTMLLGGVVSLLVVGAIWQLMPGIRRYRYDPANPYERHEQISTTR